MTTIELGKNIKVNLSELVDGVSQMEATDLEDFLREMSIVLARKKNPLSHRELELVDIAYQVYPEKEQQYYNQLQEKLKQGQLTVQEHKDLIDLVEKTETHNVKWLSAMAELAQIRKVNLPELMLQLGFKDRYKLLV